MEETKSAAPQSSPEKKSSHKTLVIVLSILAVLIVLPMLFFGIAGYIIYSKGKTFVNDVTQNVQQEIKKAGDEYMTGSTLARAYMGFYNSEGVEMKTTISTGSTTLSKFQPPETYYFMMTEKGKTTESIMTADAMYTRENKQPWTKISTATSETENAVPSFLPDKSELEDLAQKEADENSIVSEGTKPCPFGGGSCEVFKEAQDSGYTRHFVNQSSGKLVQTEVYEGERLSSTTTFEYKRVSIEIPTNAQEMKMPSNADTTSFQNMDSEIKKAIESYSDSPDNTSGSEGLNEEN